MKEMAFVQMVESIGGAYVRLFFSDGTVIERKLPGVKVAKPRVIDDGLGIDPGDGKGDMSARMLRLPCRGRRVYSLS